ncbi:type II pantothenate kinase [Paenibacillus oenotherae]|uniref:Type II pantothenate kinase n=1 Tax=Paenibacillus oenotherae TaxID=1435645 RepID=A0ABS7D134_9BACL|nr:type II pantothenate kinase [Paenibacillus oenotherae]MBW7473486.1 type II pantothenate kinase [Paenibacillus oenotherae]
MNIGIDAGGTLIKAAYRHEDSLELVTFPIAELVHVASWLNEMQNADICITGGKASLLQRHLKQEAREIVEFQASCRGAQYLLEQNHIAEESYILTNVGTGTSIHYVDRGVQRRVGGTGIGGGTMVGLSRLLTGLSEYGAIVEAAAGGLRDRIDLTVGHIYEGGEPPIPGHLTASNFGSVARSAAERRYREPELAASVIGMVGETVATVSVLAAQSCGVSTIVFIGSSFIGNDPLKRAVESYTELRGGKPVFLDKGEYSGALGALLSDLADSAW